MASSTTTCSELSCGSKSTRKKRYFTEFSWSTASELSISNSISPDRVDDSSGITHQRDRQRLRRVVRLLKVLSDGSVEQCGEGVPRGGHSDRDRQCDARKD